ncbi:TetR/AcrR family transcriptional regulator [Actinoplanes sp. G11-F43]|uniref:TetR/AcrR family transcriptional regulator n=1 Tax=Actinoplanes sp. G11-F43 TaxID=3424130 RepID=UPI003D331BF0
MEEARGSRILDAVLALLAEHGISGVSIRAVAGRAEVAQGLVNYYYGDKTGLIRAALERIEAQDLALLAVDPAQPPGQRLRTALRRVADPEFLTPAYLSLRLQLWALASAHPDYAEINTRAQAAYRAELAALIRAARPALPIAEANRRAADVDVIQNGIWLTALLGLDADSISRNLARCEEIALAP